VKHAARAADIRGSSAQRTIARLAITPAWWRQSDEVKGFGAVNYF
jgi:hypothetical protein